METSSFALQKNLQIKPLSCSQCVQTPETFQGSMLWCIHNAATHLLSPLAKVTPNQAKLAQQSVFHCMNVRSILILPLCSLYKARLQEYHKTGLFAARLLQSHVHHQLFERLSDTKFSLLPSSSLSKLLINPGIRFR